MHDIFDSVPVSRIGRIRVFRVTGEEGDGKTELLGDLAPDTNYDSIRMLYGPGEYEIRAFSPQGKPITPAGTIRQKLAAPPDEDEDEDEDEDDEDNDNDEDNDEDEDKPRHQPSSKKSQHADMRDDRREYGGYREDPRLPTAPMFPGRFGQSMQPAPQSDWMSQALASGDPRAIDVLKQLFMAGAAPGAASVQTHSGTSATERELQRKLDTAEDDLRSLRRAKDREIDDLRSDHARELRKRDDEHRDEVNVLKRDFEDRLTASNNEWKARLQRVERDLEDRLTQQRQFSNQQIDMSSMPLNSRISFLDSENKRLAQDCEKWRKLYDESEDQVRKLRAEMANRDIAHTKQIFDKDTAIKEAAQNSSAASSGSTAEEGKPGVLNIMTQFADAIPTFANALNVINKLNSGEVPTPTAPSKPTPKPIRPAQPQQASPPPPPPPPPVGAPAPNNAAPNGAPPRVRAPSSSGPQ